MFFKILFQGSENKIVVCFFSNWAQYREGEQKFLPENIDVNLCTHIIYSFAKLIEDSLEPYEWNDVSTSWSKGLYERSVALKEKNPNLKVMLAIGGWNHGSGSFSKMALDDTKRANFVRNSINYLKKHKFDGLDLGEIKFFYISICYSLII